MKRQVLTGLLTTMMVASMAMPVAAESQTTTLTTSKASDYTLTIPASSKDITYNTVDTALGDLYVKGNVNVGENVSVSVVTNAFQRTGSTSDTIEFNLMDTSVSGNPTAYTTTTWSEEELRAASPKQIPLSVNIPTDTWANAKAGAYTGSIVFTAKLNTPD